jgi:hypothetical protein
MQAEQARSPWHADSPAFGGSPGAAAPPRLQEPAGAAKPLTSRSAASGKAP